MGKMMTTKIAKFDDGKQVDCFHCPATDFIPWHSYQPTIAYFLNAEDESRVTTRENDDGEEEILLDGKRVGVLQ